jgi:hypothetical protein
MGCKILQVFFFLVLVHWNVGSIKVLAKGKKKFLHRVRELLYPTLTLGSASSLNNLLK